MRNNDRRPARIRGERAAPRHEFVAEMSDEGGEIDPPFARVEDRALTRHSSRVDARRDRRNLVCGQQEGVVALVLDHGLEVVRGHDRRVE